MGELKPKNKKKKHVFAMRIKKKERGKREWREGVHKEKYRSLEKTEEEEGRRRRRDEGNET